tara:strand:+ start:254 stop:568 length:315 start_codon:yes stop_codon:yes gene_type:complete
MKNKIEKKKPWEVMFEGRPYSSELDYQMQVDSETEGGIEWWDNLKSNEVIKEVEQILYRYTRPEYGWVHAEEIEDGSEGAIKERNDLRKVVAHLKKQYKKYYAN